jgi:hypothetical protein
MDLHDTARVRLPRDGVEYRLGIVTRHHVCPSLHRHRRLRLRFPSGDERSYTTDEITPCTRDDDRTSLVAAVTEGCRSLRDACRIAHDHDDELSAEISFLVFSLVGFVNARLGVALDPANLPGDATPDPPPAGERP